MVIYVENLMKLKILQELVSEFNKVTGHNINMQKSIDACNKSQKLKFKNNAIFNYVYIIEHKLVYKFLSGHIFSFLLGIYLEV